MNFRVKVALLKVVVGPKAHQPQISMRSLPHHATTQHHEPRPPLPSSRLTVAYYLLANLLCRRSYCIIHAIHHHRIRDELVVCVLPSTLIHSVHIHTELDIYI